MNHDSNNNYSFVRKFLPIIKHLPFDYLKQPNVLIEEVYLFNTGDNFVCKKIYRDVCRYYYINRQIKEDLNTEIARPINEDKYAFYLLKKECSLAKLVYYVSWPGLKMELNIFLQQLDGHVQLLIRFRNKKQALDFKPFDWLGKDITNDELFNEKKLARTGLLY